MHFGSAELARLEAIALELWTLRLGIGCIVTACSEINIHVHFASETDGKRLGGMGLQALSTSLLEFYRGFQREQSSNPSWLLIDVLHCCFCNGDYDAPRTRTPLLDPSLFLSNPIRLMVKDGIGPQSNKCSQFCLVSMRSLYRWIPLVYWFHWLVLARLEAMEVTRLA